MVRYCLDPFLYQGQCILHGGTQLVHPVQEAPKAFLFLHQDDLIAAVCKGKGGRHSGHAAAYDQGPGLDL